jgi:hypothetical protein
MVRYRESISEALFRTQDMSFFTEPIGYEKTILSDLKGAWECLREAIIAHAGFAGWDRTLFHSMRQ